LTTCDLAGCLQIDSEDLVSCNFRWPSHGGGVPGNALGEWPRDQPHISGFLENVTVSEALDYVLKTFPGVWIYENCPARGDRGRDMFFGFFRLPRVGSKVFRWWEAARVKTNI
jgi:hypothetical protein